MLFLGPWWFLLLHWQQFTCPNKCEHLSPTSKGSMPGTARMAGGWCAVISRYSKQTESLSLKFCLQASDEMAQITSHIITPRQGAAASVCGHVRVCGTCFSRLVCRHTCTEPAAKRTPAWGRTETLLSKHSWLAGWKDFCSDTEWRRQRNWYYSAAGVTTGSPSQQQSDNNNTSELRWPWSAITLTTHSTQNILKTFWQVKTQNKW